MLAQVIHSQRDVRAGFGKGPIARGVGFVVCQEQSVDGQVSDRDGEVGCFVASEWPHEGIDLKEMRSCHVAAMGQGVRRVGVEGSGGDEHGNMEQDLSGFHWCLFSGIQNPPAMPQVFRILTSKSE